MILFLWRTLTNILTFPQLLEEALRKEFLILRLCIHLPKHIYKFPEVRPTPYTPEATLAFGIVS